MDGAKPATWRRGAWLHTSRACYVRVSRISAASLSASFIWHNSYLSSLWVSRHGCHHPASIAESGTVMTSEYVTVVVSSNPTQLKMR